MRQRRITLADVANEVGVSKMTVSAVLTGSSKHVRVSDTTREQVLKAAEALGYQPNALARSLRRNRTDIIGFYCGYGFLNARNPFLSEIIGGLQDGCDRHQKDLLLHGGFRAGSTAEIYSGLVAGMIDGLIINTSPDDPLVHKLASSVLPVVAITDPIPAIPSICVDDTAGAEAMIAHLHERGHRKVVYRHYANRRTSIERRRAAIISAAGRFGMQLEEWRAENNLDETDETLRRYLCDRSPDRATAVICYNDLTALEVLSQCRRFGIRVPEDLAVVGFDGITFPFGADVPLTTVRANWPEVARAAISLLVARCAGEQVPTETVMPVQLTIGATS